MWLSTTAGAPAQAGDATWSGNSWQVSEWATRGGDFSAAASSSLLVGDPNQFYTWSSTPLMMADVQGWLDTPQDDFGWILADNEATSLKAKRFDSSEAGIVAQRSCSC